jgi:hypothetical protein
MYAVSSSFLAMIRTSSMKARVQITSTAGTTLLINDGSVSMDSRRNITRTASLSLAPTSTLTAQQVYELVMQPDFEILIQRGVELADGSIEYVPLGVFSTDNAEYSASVSGDVRWQGSDRSKKISRARFTDPYQITAGTSLATAVGNLLRSRWASTPINFNNVTETLAAQVVWEAGSDSDPWNCARQLMSDYGYDLNFDGLGTARAVAVTDPTTAAIVFDFGTGSTQMLLDATIQGSFESTYNGVIASGEGSNVTAPVRAEVWDTNPSSPTYYLGGFGKVPYFYSSPMLTTQAQCQTAAAKILSVVKGKTQSLAWPSIVNPALEPLDVVSMTFGGITKRAVIDQLTVPLRVSEPMTASARETYTT